MILKTILKSRLMRKKINDAKMKTNRNFENVVSHSIKIQK